MSWWLTRIGMVARTARVSISRRVWRRCFAGGRRSGSFLSGDGVLRVQAAGDHPGEGNDVHGVGYVPPRFGGRRIADNGDVADEDRDAIQDEGDGLGSFGLVDSDRMPPPAQPVRRWLPVGSILMRLRPSWPKAVRLLQDQAIAPVDMAQSAIGPGMEMFSRYAKVARGRRDTHAGPHRAHPNQRSVGRGSCLRRRPSSTATPAGRSPGITSSVTSPDRSGTRRPFPRLRTHR